MKIVTNKDREKQKALKTRRAIPISSEGDMMEVASGSYIDGLLTTAHSKAHIETADPRKEDEIIKKNFENWKMLDFGKNGVTDNRVSPGDERRIKEFASRLTKNNPNLIVELADRHFSVYGKDPHSNGSSRDYVPGLEFAEYPRPGKKKEVVEG